ncbi:MAG: cadherin repeat domain-containing protein [Bacteroidales bacterium]
MKRTLSILLLLLTVVMAQAQRSKDKAAVQTQTIGVFKATNPLPTPMTFEILSSGNTGNYFTIGIHTGVIQVKRTAYTTFRKSRTWTLKVKIKNDEGSITRKATVTLNKIKDRRGNVIRTSEIIYNV